MNDSYGCFSAYHVADGLSYRQLLMYNQRYS